MPECGGIHAFEILDHLEHAHFAVAFDEGLELVRNPIEFLGQDATAQDDLDRLGVVMFGVGKHWKLS